MTNNNGPEQDNNKKKGSFKRDIAILLFSIIAAVLIMRTGVVQNILDFSDRFLIIGSFVAGLFWVSIFTAAPAIAVMFALLATGPLLTVSFFGGLGAALGDFLIFKFFSSLTSFNFDVLIARIKAGQIRFWFKSGLAWIAPLFGALVIASPLPDELGLALMGFSNFPAKLMIPLTFILNFCGILIAGLIIKQIV
jgi:hypothetical protein